MLNIVRTFTPTPGGNRYPRRQHACWGLAKKTKSAVGSVEVKLNLTDGYAGIKAGDRVEYCVGEGNETGFRQSTTGKGWKVQPSHKSPASAGKTARRLYITGRIPSELFMIGPITNGGLVIEGQWNPQEQMLILK